MNPTEVYEALRDSYLRYLETSFHLKDRSLLNQFRQLLRDKTQPPLVRQPILEVSPGFKLGASVEQLIEERVLPGAFRKFQTDLLKRPLYTHQDRALRKIIAENRNVVVATGTGSGKTEIFLYSIISNLLGEAESKSLDIPGVRALLLYPMNALANDQIARLRTIAKLFPEITFGRYTGETDQDHNKALKIYQLFHNGESPLKNELICRDQMRESPPHILFTNYAMLEYLLIRPKDSGLFKGNRWQFLVLDEVHTYSGALGVEIAMLLRRLKERVVQSEQGRLRCIATSATLGDGERDFPKIARFASDLFGERFESDDIIGVDPLDLKFDGPAWGAGSPGMYSALKGAIFDADQCAVGELAKIAGSHEAPTRIVEAALAEARRYQSKEGCQAFLRVLMEGDRNVRELREQLNIKRALELSEVRGIVGPNVVDLVALGAQARGPGDSGPLIPARYHIMARAISGIYAWFDGTGRPRLLAKRERCHQESGKEHAVFELASCNRCGEIMLVGEEKNCHIVQPPDVGDDPIAKLSWFQLRDAKSDSELDEDDALEENEDPSHVRPTNVSPMRLCRVCGRIEDESTFDLNGCEGHVAETLTVFEIENKPRRNVPRQCPSCRNIHGSVASRIVTGKQVPVAVLATALYQKIPASNAPKEEFLPGEGRKLMMFSDSRQDAAFFAPFMDNTYNKFKQRRYLVQALEGEPGSLDLSEWAHRTLRVAENAGEWDEDSSAAMRKRDVARWVLREWIATDRRLALEGAGSAIFHLRRPERFAELPVLSGPPWDMKQGEQWDMIEILLDTIRYQGIVSFDEDFSSVGHDDAIFAPRNVDFYLRGASSNAEKRIYAWEPAPDRSNKRLDYLRRVLRRKGVVDPEAKECAFSALKEIWATVNHPNGPLRKLFEQGPHHKYRNEGALFRLKPAWWQVRRAGDMDVYRCDTCRTVTAFAVNNVCPMTGCAGNIAPYRLNERAENHYYNLFTSMNPIPLKVSEHTAQLTKAKAFEAQQDFINGKVNMLSCTTTFEMGVDVGELQTVFMRNMPPSPGNYVQRAGRAGRRANSAAVVVSYAQRRTHDFAYFENWLRMVRGSVRAPSIHLNNTKIIRRHIHAEALADYFSEHPETFADRLESLFDPETSRPNELIAHLANHPERLRARLIRIIPPALHLALGIDDWQWLQGKQMKTEERGETFEERLAHATQDVHGDWNVLKGAVEVAEREKKYKAADFLMRQLKTLKERSLLGKLGTYGLMPKYGFPTDVVELKIRGGGREGSEIELERDMKLALSEFAPGNEIIAGGRVWTSGAIVLPSGNRKLHEFNYWQCDACGYFAAENVVATGAQATPIRVCHCANPIDAKSYYYPEFGFSTPYERSGSVGDERPSLKSYSEVFFHDDAAKSMFIPIKDVSRILYREATEGWIHVINNNQGNDFYICGSCGYATRENPAYSRVGNTPHTKPWTSDQACLNTRLERRGLGYRYRTDVLELRFPLDCLDVLKLRGRDEFHSLWLSVLYALVNGACQALDINERDLGGCLYYSEKSPPSLVLFDTSPGGAGFVNEVRNHFAEVLTKARNMLDCNSCGEDSSCIACLRTYFNQRDHNSLRRGWARSYLEALRR